jgi:hypothetical protein
MTAVQFVDQLKKWHIPYREDFNDWATHNRGNRGTGWGPVHGIIQHHTGADNTSPGYLYEGNSSLPGPLCHVANDVDGILHLIGWGRTNHAGGGDPAVLRHVTHEDYGSHILVPKFGEGDEGSYDGNAVFYGIENIYSGSHPMSEKQLHTAILFSAAVCDFHNWSSLSVIGHGEWSNQKHDPSITKPEKLMDMVAFRRSVQLALDAHKEKSKSIPKFPGTLKPGVNSPSVTLLDRQLIHLGYGKYYKVGPGPYFGDATAKAVKAWLTKHPLYQTGKGPDTIVGPKTWEAIFKGE